LGKAVARPEPDWFVDGAAGMSSTVNDMANWLRLQLNQGRFDNRQLVTGKSMALMHQPPPGTRLPYGMGWFVNDPLELHHNGIFWTYSSEELLLTKNGYGVVILFNGGLNPFIDYHAFSQGIADILAGQALTESTLPDWVYRVAIELGLLVAIGLGIRRLFRRKQWEQAYQHRPVWRSWVYLAGRLLPILFFVMIPALLTLLSGRVLNWARIFLMMPDLIVVLALIGLLQLAILITRLFRLSTL